MCGFVGVLKLNHEPVQGSLLKKMADMLRHRGPDDDGIFVDGNLGLGFRRLSIIDLQGGHQPMTTADGRYTIVFNGEIYNYVELREQLIQTGVLLKTQSDTEVLLELYARKGKDCLSLVNGMFAFAVWDNQKRELFLARDRFGIKPLYYYCDSGRFIFASEIKAIIADRSIKREPDYRSIADYLSFMYVPDDKTFFQGIKKLLPGYCAVISEQGKLQMEPYWDLRFDYVSKSEAQLVEELRNLLQDAVKVHLRSDVPLGCHLSGGLDSTTVVCLSAKHLQMPIKTFSGKFNEGEFYDETKYAKIVARYANTTYLETIPDIAFFQDSLAKLIWYMDEPAVGPGIIPQYAVCRLASQHVKVVLGGQGGDEIFGGYPRYFLTFELLGLQGHPLNSKRTSRLNGFLRKAMLVYGYAQQHGVQATWNKIRQRVKQVSTRDASFEQLWRKHSTSSSVFNQMLGPRLLETRSQYDADESFFHYLRKGVSDDPFDQMLYHDIKAYLPGLLQVEDRTSMAVSMESRVPLLDYRIAELAASIPSSIKVKGLDPKYIFKRAIKGIIPDEVLNRKDKKGFPTPIYHWFRQDPAFLQNILLDRTARDRGLIHPQAIENALFMKEDCSWQIWPLLNVELWFKIFIDEDCRFVDADGYIHEKVELA